MTHFIVVSFDSVHLAFFIAELDDLYILSGDTQNTYLNDPTKEKVFFYAGDELNSDEVKVVVIVRDIYGLKSSDLAWMNNLS